MEYRHVGRSGLRISELSFGSWETFSRAIGTDSAKACMHRAVDHGINFFDTAEAYAAGEAEEIMGQVLNDFRREEYVVSPKSFGVARPPMKQACLASIWSKARAIHSDASSSTTWISCTVTAPIRTHPSKK